MDRYFRILSGLSFIKIGSFEYGLRDLSQTGNIVLDISGPSARDPNLLQQDHLRDEAVATSI